MIVLNLKEGIAVETGESSRYIAAIDISCDKIDMYDYLHMYETA